MKQYRFCDVDLNDLKIAQMEFAAAELLGRQENMEQFCINDELINALVYSGYERLSERLDHLENEVIA